MVRELSWILRSYSKEFYDILEDYENRITRATENSCLPDNPDMERVEAFVERINRMSI